MPNGSYLRPPRLVVRSLGAGEEGTMLRRGRAVGVVIFQLGFLWGHAWGQGTPERLIQEIEARRQQIAEVQLEGLVVSETRYEGMIRRTEREFWVAFKRPNLFRFELRGEFPKLILSDGQWVWHVTQYPERSRGYKRPVNAQRPLWFDSWIGLLIPVPMGSAVVLTPPTAPIVREIVLRGQEDVETRTGERIPCYVFEAAVLSLYDVRMRLWIGIPDAIPWKIESTAIPTPPSMERESKIMILTTKVTMGGDLPLSLFAPPPEMESVR
jgi:hypothetical protein